MTNLQHDLFSFINFETKIYKVRCPSSEKDFLGNRLDRLLPE